LRSASPRPDCPLGEHRLCAVRALRAACQDHPDLGGRVCFGAASRARKPGRAGGCELGQALAVFLTGQEAVRCGELGRALTNEDYERARACVIAAQRARKPFTLVWGGPNIDSVRREAVAARVTAVYTRVPRATLRGTSA